MELKVSIFDVLTYLLPGLLYLTSLVLLSDLILEQNILFPLLSPTISQAITFLIVSYILGHTLQPLYRLSPFVHIFKGKVDENTDQILEKIKGNLNDIRIKNGCSSRAILEKILSLHDEKLSRSSSRFLALAIFMRNLSFPFMLLAFVVVPRFEQIGIPQTAFLTISLIAMSLLSSYRSARYRRFANVAAIEGMTALHLKDYNFFDESGNQ